MYPHIHKYHGKVIREIILGYRSNIYLVHWYALYLPRGSFFPNEKRFTVLKS